MNGFESHELIIKKYHDERYTTKSIGLFLIDEGIPVPNRYESEIWTERVVERAISSMRKKYGTQILGNNRGGIRKLHPSLKKNSLSVKLVEEETVISTIDEKHISSDELVVAEFGKIEAYLTEGFELFAKHLENMPPSPLPNSLPITETVGRVATPGLLGKIKELSRKAFGL